MIGALQTSYRYLFKHKLLLVITVIAWILSLIPFVFDGQYGCVNGQCGLIIGSNYRDGMWFLSVAKTAFKTIPFQMPIYAGEQLQGYHYLPNLFAYLLSFIGIPVLVTYYKIIPITFMALLTPLLVYYARKIHDSPLFVGIFLFTSFFGMHLSLILSLYHSGFIDNSGLINTFQSTRLLESPHTALAMLMMFAVLIMIHEPKKMSMKKVLLCALFIFLSIGTKVYVAATILLLLGLHEFTLLIKTKNVKHFFINSIIFALSTIVSLYIFYNPFGSSNNSSVFVFSPFATVHHLIEAPNMFYINSLVLARYFLYEHGLSPRLLAIELFSAALFVLYYFGTRTIGFFYIAKKIITRTLNRFEAILFITILILILISVLFIQKGDWFNPIQFAVPAAFIMNIFVALTLYETIKKHRFLGFTFLSLFVLLTFPANLVNLGYIQSPSRYVISQGEMEALQFVKQQPAGVVLHPRDNDDMAYVSTFTEKQTYVNFINVLQNAGIDYQKRLDEVENIDAKSIETIDIDYIYIPLSNEKNIDLNIQLTESVFVKEIFKNDDAVVYQKLAIPQVPEPNLPEEEMVFCTLDVKLCPDGSYVSREPPSCEFQKCP